MTTPLPFAWPYFLIFWPTYFWVYLPESRVLNKATRSGPVPVEDRGSLRIIMIGFSVATLAGFLIPFLVPRAALPGPSWVWFFLGLLVLVAGSLLRRHCFRVLGAFFTGAVTIQSDHRVIDSGAYRFVRHP